MAVARYIIVGGLSAIMTLALFYLMHSLIVYGADKELKEVPPNRIIEFVRQQRQDVAEEEDEKLPEKLEMSEAPPPPALDLPSSADSPGAMALNVDAPKIEEPRPDIKLSGGPSLDGAAADADVIPLVRVQPMYPPSAAQQRIEGWVIIEFTISTMGSVKDARVLSAQPNNIFNRAALQAIRKWKYKPKIEEGKRVERRGIEVKLTFELDDIQ